LTLADKTGMCHCMDTMTRLKKMMSLALDPDLLRRMDAWISKQEFPPTKTAVLETALREFLDKRDRRK
jgi:Arc/MetJ-type ribon-helix-helix transcriptional regulator